MTMAQIAATSLCPTPITSTTCMMGTFITSTMGTTTSARSRRMSKLRHMTMLTAQIAATTPSNMETTWTMSTANTVTQHTAITTTSTEQAAEPGIDQGVPEADPDVAQRRRDLEQRYGAVAALFAALGAPVRASIVHLLTVRGRSVTELVDELGVSQPLVSQHLRTLRTVGLVEVDRDGRTGVYRLADEHVAHIFLDAFQHSREGEDRA